MDNENKALINKARIFEITTNNSLIKEPAVPIPLDLWQHYFLQFKWLSYKNGILQCWTCQEVFQKFPDKIESDEWTTPNVSNYQPLNKNNVILILKLHNFSESHMEASKLLNQISDTKDDNLSEKAISCSVQSNSVISPTNFVSLTLTNENVNTNTENMELLRSFDRKHFETFLNDGFFPHFVIDLQDDNKDIINNQSNGCNVWSRYLTRYLWLYCKDDNPGCKYCEQAFRLSQQMSFTKWTSPNMIADSVSQDRPNRTLLQHDRSKNHRIAEEVLVEHNIIAPPSVIIKSTIEDSKHDELIQYDASHAESECPLNFPVERWDRFTKNYSWLYYKSPLFHCTFCERAFELHPNRMTQTSWTNSQFDSSRIKDTGRARHYFYDHQRSNNHQIATNILQMEGVISSKNSDCNDDYDELDESRDFSQSKSLYDNSIDFSKSKLLYDNSSDFNQSKSLYDNSTDFSQSKSFNDYSTDLTHDNYLDHILNDKQWEQLSLKYPWLVGNIGKSYGCSVCQKGRQKDPLTVNVSQWTQGRIQFMKTKYVQLRKSLWCHSVTRNHISAINALQKANAAIADHQYSSTVSLDCLI